MKHVALLLTACLAFWACKPDSFEEIGPEYDLISGIDGHWEIARVDAIDLTLPVPEGRNISDFYTQSAIPLGINFDAKTNEYSVVNAQTAGNFFGDGGRFAFDDPRFPKRLTLYSNANDTLGIALLNMVREIDPEMGLSYTREACGTEYLRYNYTFKRK